MWCQSVAFVLHRVGACDMLTIVHWQPDSSSTDDSDVFYFPLDRLASDIPIPRFIQESHNFALEKVTQPRKFRSTLKCYAITRKPQVPSHAPPPPPSQVALWMGKTPIPRASGLHFDIMDNVHVLLSGCDIIVFLFICQFFADYHWSGSLQSQTMDRVQPRGCTTNGVH